MLFRELSQEEAVKFRAWARENYEPLSRISDMWHPVVREECLLINKEVEKEIDDFDRERLNRSDNQITI